MPHLKVFGGQSGLKCLREVRKNWVILCATARCIHGIFATAFTKKHPFLTCTCFKSCLPKNQIKLFMGLAWVQNKLLLSTEILNHPWKYPKKTSKIKFISYNIIILNIIKLVNSTNKNTVSTLFCSPGLIFRKVAGRLVCFFRFVFMEWFTSTCPPRSTSICGVRRTHWKGFTVLGNGGETVFNKKTRVTKYPTLENNGIPTSKTEPFKL